MAVSVYAGKHTHARMHARTRVHADVHIPVLYVQEESEGSLCPFEVCGKWNGRKVYLVDIRRVLRMLHSSGIPWSSSATSSTIRLSDHCGSAGYLSDHQCGPDDVMTCISDNTKVELLSADLINLISECFPGVGVYHAERC